MPGPFVGSLGPFRPISMVDQIHIDVGIKGRITSPRAQIRWHERDRASWYCLASDCRGKKLAATADCNNPVNFSRVSNIDQRAARFTNKDPITSRGGAASLSQVSVAYRGAKQCWVRVLEPHERLNVIKKLEFQAAQYAASGGRLTWISPRFSSFLFSFCC
jgi:hypothetical protein